MQSPIVVGGNGHSGTRLFAEILISCGVFMGIPTLSYDKNSKDLNIRGLMNRWMRAYLSGLDDAEADRMRRQFLRRIRLLIPYQRRTWGFKNPRAMFLLPFYHSLYPDLKFIHVIRDGRDMCFGNPFINSPTYWGLLSEEEANSLTPQERMIKFWGKGNLKVQDYGKNRLGSNYLCIRFEDICDNPQTEITRIVDFIDAPSERVADLTSLVHKPKSIGRWMDYPADDVDHVVTIGRDYLREFGYMA